MTQFKGGNGLSSPVQAAGDGSTNLTTVTYAASSSSTSSSPSPSTLLSSTKIPLKTMLRYATYMLGCTILVHSVLFYGNGPVALVLVQEELQKGTSLEGGGTVAAPVTQIARLRSSSNNPTDDAIGGVSSISSSSGSTTNSDASYDLQPYQENAIENEQEQEQEGGIDSDGGTNLSGQRIIASDNDSSSTIASSSPPTPPTTIFYNIYIPPNDPEGRSNAYSIIQEQMRQIGEPGQSTYTSSHTKDISIQYITIGEPFDGAFMDDLCTLYQIGSCHHVVHHAAGYEMLTQQVILDYCNEEDENKDENENEDMNNNNNDDDSRVVTYIHNKGALHSAESQSRLRRWLTGSALSPQCMEELHRTNNVDFDFHLNLDVDSKTDPQEKSCNVCGANFKSVWGPTYWGNMWSAKCSYVKKLVSPFDLEGRNKEAVDSKPAEMTMSLYGGMENIKNAALGVGRFAAEQFVSTHPSLIPCSFTNLGVAEVEAFWAVDPPGRFDFHVIKTVMPNLSEMGVDNNHLKEWYLLPGVLWRYHVLYNELPPPDSWIWRHYPDGDTWQRAIEEMGFPEALYHRIATETPSGLESSNNMNEESEEVVDEEEDEQNTTSSPTTIFYNIYIPPNDPEGIARAYDIVEDQMKQIGDPNESTYTSSHANEISIHYITIGEPFNEKFMDDLCDLHQFASCHHISHHATGYEMLTQQVILDYCNEDGGNIDGDLRVVSYIHNKGSLHSADFQSRVRRRLTGSALSPQCIEQLHIDSQESCNVCGANFKSVWGPTLWGNMWSAKCSYVKKLVSPFDLEALNREAVDSKPAEMTMNLFGDKHEANEAALGVGRFAAEQFVSTHPSLIPCSFIHPAPAGVDAFWAVDPPGPFDSHVITGLIPNLDEMNVESNYLKEWYFLPGVLWRYHVLYNELPPLDSWIWRHYPDGERWKGAIEEMGFPEALYHRIATETS